MRQFPLLLLLAACSADTSKTVEATDSSDEGSADGSGAADTGADATADAVADADDATEGSGSGEPALTEEERHAALTLPPWTRLLSDGASTDWSGAAIASLPAFVAAHPDELILKRSWAYGGKSVILAEHLHEPSTQEKLREMFRLPADAPFIDWPKMVELALHDPGDVWIVQRIVQPAVEPRLCRNADGSWGWAELVADLSMYTSPGINTRMRGGAVRVSASKIVNIATGGGMAPLLRAEVAQPLLDALAQNQAR